MSLPGGRLLGIAALLLLTVHAHPEAASQERIVDAFPVGDLFRPILADPKQPRFSGSYLWYDSNTLGSHVAAVAFGESFGLLRFPRLFQGEFQISIAAGVFAQLDLHLPATSLVNADYLVGLPFTWRRGDLSTRLRWYHQSSHLGDEYLLASQPERLDLSFEVVELLLSWESRGARLFGGGEFIYNREPEDLKRGLAHAGVEYRHPRPLFRLGETATAHWVAGLDVKSWEQDNWAGGWSLAAGVECCPTATTRAPFRRRAFTAVYYHGFSPYGQFFDEDVTAFGFSVQFNL
ncbi:MAG: DUF1207 domain-containing protein [Dehalococcoidia bacterium]|nr:MAG: DUF1207 domain-containing protein [Dehalococcoidia bacterium]